MQKLFFFFFNSNSTYFLIGLDNLAYSFCLHLKWGLRKQNKIHLELQRCSKRPWFWPPMVFSYPWGSAEQVGAAGDGIQKNEGKVLVTPKSLITINPLNWGFLPHKIIVSYLIRRNSELSVLGAGGKAASNAEFVWWHKQWWLLSSRYPLFLVPPVGKQITGSLPVWYFDRTVGEKRSRTTFETFCFWNPVCLCKHLQPKV